MKTIATNLYVKAIPVYSWPRPDARSALRVGQGCTSTLQRRPR